jgi:hypothetical protein
MSIPSTPPLPQHPLPQLPFSALSMASAQPLPPPILSLRPVSAQPSRPDSNTSSMSATSSLTVTPLMSPKVNLPMEPEPPNSLFPASAETPSHLLAAMAAGAMALTNPLLLNPLLFSTSMMQSLQNGDLTESDLIKNMVSMMPQLPPMMAPLLSLNQQQFKKPSIADTFSLAFGEDGVAKIRHLLEAVNASVTKSLLEDNLKKWAASSGLSADDILEQFAQSQPLSPGSLLRNHDDDYTTDEETASSPSKKSASSSSASRARAMISDDQVVTLKTYYGINSKPRREELLKISDEIGHPFKVVKVWFQNTRARDRRDSVKTSFSAFNAATKLLLPPTPPASCSTGSQKHSSPNASPLAKDEDELMMDEDKEVPMDLSTKPSTPSASPPPLVINSEAEDDDTEDEDDDDEEEEEHTTAFPMTSLRPPIDIDQVAKQHFNKMIQAKLVMLEPTAEAMLPDAPVASVEITTPTTSTASASPVPKKSVTKNNGGGGGDSSASAATFSPSGSGGPVVYTCDQCDKTFTKKSSITRHKYEHSGNWI